MKLTRSAIYVTLLALLMVGCTSTKITNRDEYAGGQIPRPARIIVYDFAVTPADLPIWADVRSQYADAKAAMTADELAAGRKLGADLAEKLVKDINDMGMTAVRSVGEPGPQLNDIAIVGYFSSVDTGSAVERVVIGFGKGSAKVGTHAEGYRDTATGMQKLGGGNVEDGGAGKSPGLVVPALVTIATANPIGLLVGGAVKAEGEVSGRTTDVGSADRIADEIAKALKVQFHKQGWI